MPKQGRPLSRSEDPDEELPVAVGQVWEDMNIARAGRTVKVLQIVYESLWMGVFEDSAYVISNTGRHSWIRLDRFKPTSNGYRLRSQP